MSPAFHNIMTLTWFDNFKIVVFVEPVDENLFLEVVVQGLTQQAISVDTDFSTAVEIWKDSIFY